jgi:hypothetical protein
MFPNSVWFFSYLTFKHVSKTKTIKKFSTIYTTKVLLSVEQVDLKCLHIIQGGHSNKMPRVKFLKKFLWHKNSIQRQVMIHMQKWRNALLMQHSENMLYSHTSAKCSQSYSSPYWSNSYVRKDVKTNWSYIQAYRKPLKPGTYWAVKTGVIYINTELTSSAEIHLLNKKLCTAQISITE